jgi:hypothetical protein
MSRFRDVAPKSSEKAGRGRSHFDGSKARHAYARWNDESGRYACELDSGVFVEPH